MNIKYIVILKFVKLFTNSDIYLTADRVEAELRSRARPFAISDYIIDQGIYPIPIQDVSGLTHSHLDSIVFLKNSRFFGASYGNRYKTHTI